MYIIQPIHNRRRRSGRRKEKKMEHQLHTFQTQHKKTNDGKCIFVVGGICSIGCCGGPARIRRLKTRSFINLDCFSLSLSSYSVYIQKVCGGIYTHKPYIYTLPIYSLSFYMPCFILLLFFFLRDSQRLRVHPLLRGHVNESVTCIHLLKIYRKLYHY